MQVIRGNPDWPLDLCTLHKNDLNHPIFIKILMAIEFCRRVTIGGNMSFYDDLGGKKTLEKVHKIFYDKIYAHPWIGLYFKEIDQKIIENQQTDFMVQSFGGPAEYLGKLPGPAHKHMFITEELFTLRQNLLRESLEEAGVSPEHIQKWLKIDGAFKATLVKSNVEDCEKRFKTDEILNFPKKAS